MRLKHSPAPWKVHEEAEYPEYSSRPAYTWVDSIIAADGSVVVTFEDDFGPELEANANLMAAAPELLRAAEFAMLVMPEGQPETRQLREAIAKAKGETQ